MGDAATCADTLPAAEGEGEGRGEPGAVPTNLGSWVLGGKLRGDVAAPAALRGVRGLTPENDTSFLGVPASGGPSEEVVSHRGLSSQPSLATRGVWATDASVPNDFAWVPAVAAVLAPAGCTLPFAFAWGTQEKREPEQQRK